MEAGEAAITAEEAATIRIVILRSVATTAADKQLVTAGRMAAMAWAAPSVDLLEHDTAACSQIQDGIVTTMDRVMESTRAKDISNRETQ